MASVSGAERMRVDVPVGKVRFYDAEKGFGFLTKDEGGDVYVRATALPPGVTTLKAGQKVEFGVVEGRKGEQALSVHVIETPPSLAKAARKPAKKKSLFEKVKADGAVTTVTAVAAFACC